MPNLVALHSTAHQKLKIDPDKIDKQGAHERMVPVVTSEFSKLVVHYPIVLTKNIETSRFVCVALLGFENGENLFWKDEAWDGIYTPLNIARQPFFIGTQANKESVVCINTESDCIVNTDQDPQNNSPAQALFDEHGNDTDFMRQFKGMLAELVDGEGQTSALIQALLDFELLTPIKLEITFVDQSSNQVQGLYTIDEEKLGKLTDDEFVVLRKQDMLKPIYTMIASISHIYSLIQKKNQRLQT